MASKYQITEEEQALFRETVRDAVPLCDDRVSPYRQRPRPHPQQQERDDREVLRDLLSDPLDPADLETGDELLFARAGLQHTVTRKLRRGHYSIRAELDLHGLTSKEARQAVVEFLADCHRQDIRCVRIIHGKGNGSMNREPILKRKVAHWLRQREDVLAYASATPTDGGTGAVYVLLRRPR
ncbi:Smr/MutS family protein [Thiohalomonas denitrificans]|uniref:Smr/MutS family protein n=1 Tax=Thiohalomonas denitrificans TaxID=415747 RepID=UPI000B84564B|nr:Smr/MutS family protein [Thiohalomonas denitrificans]